MEKIILYSTGCPKCKVLESKLNAKGVTYDTVSDIEEIEKTGFSEVPLMKIGDSLLDFRSAVNWVNSLKG